VTASFVRSHDRTVSPPSGDRAALLEAAELPSGGALAATAVTTFLANPTARSLAIRHGHDGPAGVRARRAEQPATVVQP
jgi:hypothetical protein